MSVRRSHQLHELATEPVAPVALLDGLQPSGGHPKPGAEGHSACPGPLRHDPFEIVKDRGGDHTQHPSGEIFAIQRLPAPMPVLGGLQAAGGSMRLSKGQPHRSRKSRS